MGMYSGNARGLWLLDSNTVTDVEKLRGKVDFLVVYAGIGDKPSLKFADHYEVARTLDIPCIGYVEADAEICVGWSFNPDVWPNENTDPTASMIYRQTKYANGTQRNISAWIVDGSKHTQTDKKELTEGWVAGIFNHTLDRVFKRLHKPVYPLIKKTTVDLYPSGGPMITLLSKWASISTYEPALHYENTGWGSHYIPGTLDGIQQPFAPTWDFWWYGSSPIAGIQGAAVLFLFNGTKTKLYNDLGYKPAAATPIPDPTPDPDPSDTGTPTSGDGTVIPADLGAKIDALTLAVSTLAQVIMALTNIIKPFFANF
jgi:hypothetical protein